MNEKTPKTKMKNPRRKEEPRSENATKRCELTSNDNVNKKKSFTPVSHVAGSPVRTCNPMQRYMAE